MKKKLVKKLVKLQREIRVSGRYIGWSADLDKEEKQFVLAGGQLKKTTAQEEHFHHSWNLCYCVSVRSGYRI